MTLFVQSLFVFFYIKASTLADSCLLDSAQNFSWPTLRWTMSRKNDGVFPKKLSLWVEQCPSIPDHKVPHWKREYATLLTSHQKKTPGFHWIKASIFNLSWGCIEKEEGRLMGVCFTIVVLLPDLVATQKNLLSAWGSAPSFEVSGFSKIQLKSN